MTNVLSGVLFLDIVGYSRLNEERQAQALRDLDRIIAQSDSVSFAVQQGRVRIHPRGDGKLLIFSEGVYAALHAAAQISCSVRSERPFDLRMGVHYGSVRTLDPDRSDSEVVGEGVDTARRIMDVGNEGHILLSATAAALARGHKDWHYLVHSSGNCRVKHGVVLHIFSVYGMYMNRRLIGNEVTPQQVRWFRQDEKFLEASQSSSKSRAYFATFCVGLMIIAGFGVLSPSITTHTPSPAPRHAPKTPNRVAQRSQTSRIARTVVKRQKAATAKARFITIPNFVGEDFDTVEIETRQQGLKLTKKPVPSEVYEAGLVIEQNPPAGTRSQDRQIVVYVSMEDENPETPVVPPQDQEDAGESKSTESTAGADSRTPADSNSGNDGGKLVSVREED